MKTIAICNQKGGVAKTTTAINLAHYFAQRGRRTLILDLDAQGHVATGLKLPKSNGLYRLIVKEEALETVIVEARPNLFIVPNDHFVELAKEHIRQSNFREYILASILNEASFDVTLLDTPPSTDVLHVLALIASDLAIIPAYMDFFALDGVGYILKTLRTLEKYPGVTPPALVGVLPTMFDKTTNETLANLTALQKSLGSERILPPIPRDTKIREGSSHGQTVWEYSPTSPAAVGYPGGHAITNSAGNIGGYLHLAEIVEALLR